MLISQNIPNFAKLSYSKMIKRKTIGVIGGGISSLSLLLNMARKINFEEDVLKVRLFERKSQVGGRIEAEESPEDTEHQRFCADVGANFIDYENEEQKKFLDANLPHNLLQNFKKFQGKFMIFQDSKLKGSQQQKTRYFYQGGFNRMAEDWRKQVETQKTMNFAVITGNEVQRIELQKGKWKVRMTGNKKEGSEEMFDILIFGTPAPATMSILQRSSLDKGKPLLSELSKISYTKQISVIFQLEQGQMKNADSPYSILFKNHALTFICFNQQKYPSNTSNIAVIQTNEEFTQKWAKKLSPNEKEVSVNHNQIQQQIAEEIWKLVPEEIKEKFRLTKKCLGVHYWPQSLIKPLSDLQSKTELFERFNRDLNKDFVDENGMKNLYFTGDFLNNKSRVTGAMAVGIKLSQEIMKQHLDVDVKPTL